MYGMTIYQLSGIQAGIQFAHAIVEYANVNFYDIEYINWAKIDKTVVLLNGGTTNNSISDQGSINMHLQYLKNLNVKVAEFYEPDLGNQLTAIAFLADERVWDRKKYPDFDNTKQTESQYLRKFSRNKDEAIKIYHLRNFLKDFRLANQ